MRVRETDVPLRGWRNGRILYGVDSALYMYVAFRTTQQTQRVSGACRLCGRKMRLREAGEPLIGWRMGRLLRGATYAL